MMEPWNSTSDKAHKIRPDPEKAKALLKMIELREKRLQYVKSAEFTTLLIEDYYEILKEIITGLMSIDGWKTVSHELLVGYLAKHYPAFDPAEISLIDQLRVMRNDIAYRGVQIPPEYLERNQKDILQVIQKLKNTLRKRLNP